MEAAVTDKFQAIHAFWSSFGLNAYEENTVPTGDDRPAYPYITYDVAVTDFWGGPAALSGSLWYYGPSNAPAAAKLKEIEAAVGRGGKQISIDNGTVWIKKGDPFARPMSDPDDMIRRILINIIAEFETAD